MESLANVRANLENLPKASPAAAVPPSGRMRGDSMAVAVVEGWRGEIAHTLVTDRNGLAAGYRIKDPSLANWAGLARAVRENQVSDFPLCNKSFSLSYCGHDL
jgi:Ni,Fe-hydrogenase III large subunit